MQTSNQNTTKETYKESKASMLFFSGIAVSLIQDLRVQK